MTDLWPVIDSDIHILRELTKRKREIAQDPVWPSVSGSGCATPPSTASAP